LAAVHEALRDEAPRLPPLRERFDDVRGVLADHAAVAAISAQDRRVLQDAVQLVVPATEGSVALHTEPHDRNRLTWKGAVVYIDFEAACTGPLEWDLAYLADEVAAAVWPEHDRALRRVLQLGVSTCVAAACWRHVTAHPSNADMRWHAEHHLSLVRQSLR
jgi:Ser/Thr protein kinase RdoA (MazF antagonist)